MHIENKHFTVKLEGSESPLDRHFYSIQASEIKAGIDTAEYIDRYGELLLALDPTRLVEVNRASWRAFGLGRDEELIGHKEEPELSSVSQDLETASSSLAQPLKPASAIETWLNQVRERSDAHGESINAVHIDSLIPSYGKLPLLLFFVTHDQEDFTFEDRVTVFKHLKAMGVDPLQRDISGQGVLHYLVRSHQVHLLKKCISLWPELEGQVNVLWSNALTPLMCAVLSGQPDMVEELLRLGADVHLHGEEESLFHLNAIYRKTKGWTALELDRYEESKIKIANVLVDHGALDPHKIGPLKVENIKKRALIEVVGKGSDVEGKLRLLKRFVSLGGDIQLGDEDGNSLLMLACEEGSVKLIEGFTALGSDLHAINDQGENAVIKAAKKNNFQVVRYLIEKGVSTEKVGDHSKGWGALHWAVQHRNIEAMKWLSTVISPNQCYQHEGRQGLSPWGLACENNDSDSLTAMFESNNHIDIHGLVNKKYGAFSLAIIHENRKTIDWYLETMKDHKDFLIETIDEEGNDLLMLACRYNPHFRFQNTQALKKMMQYHKAPTRTNKEGETALHLIISRHDLGLVAELWGDGFDLNAKNNKGETPLDIAIKEECSEVVLFLMQKEASFNVASLMGLSEDSETRKRVQAYQLAIKEKNELNEITNTLLKNGTSQGDSDLGDVKEQKVQSHRI